MKRNSKINLCAFLTVVIMVFVADAKSAHHPDSPSVHGMLPSQGIYLLFGNQEEQFLAHLITAAPDFDQILQVNVPETVLGSLQAKNILAVEFKKRPNAFPLKEGELMQGIRRGSQKAIPIQVHTEIYLEFADLEH